MLRRSVHRLHAPLNKGPQIPGPTLHGWGRTVQKRRLEYESTDNTSGGTRPFYKAQFDGAGIIHRSTNHLECRTYFNVHQRWGTWFVNFGIGFLGLAFVSGHTMISALFQGSFWWQTHIYKRAAWW